MTENLCEWPAGCDRPKAPVTTGRPPKYCEQPDPLTGVRHNATEKFRQFGRAKTPRAPAGEPVEVTPDQASTALARTVLAFGEMTSRHRDEIGGVLDAMDASLASLTDPDRVAAALEQCITAADERVAEALARAADSDHRRIQAEQEAATARTAAGEANESAEALDERLREVEADAEQLRGWLTDEQAQRRVDANEHATAMDAAEARYAAGIDEMTAAHAADLEAVRAERDQAVERLTAEHGRVVDDLTAGHHREVAALTSELESVRRALATETAARERADTATADAIAARDALLAALPARLDAARDEVRAALEVTHAAALEAEKARAAGRVAQLEGELRGCRSELAAAQRQLDGES